MIFLAGLLMFKVNLCNLLGLFLLEETLGGLGLSIPSFKPFFFVKGGHSRIDLRVRSVYPLESFLG
jgi:hypothetical protein